MLQYPEFPHPLPSFRIPMTAPDVEPTDAPLVSVCFNYDWLPYVLGALCQLTLYTTWASEFDPPDVLAMERGQRMVQLFAAAYDDAACPLDDVPTPYWDDATDLDDEEPAATQTWYGIFDGEFHETVENFVIAGFIAYAGAPGAAVAFLTFAPKFRLAWKKDGLGGAIRVFIDGVDNGLFDTNGDPDEVLEADFVGDPDLSEHMVLQVLETVPI